MSYKVRLGIVCLTLVTITFVGMQIFNASPTLAATIDNINVTCRYISVNGKTQWDISYVKVQVALASDLTKVIAQQVVSTHGHQRAGADYKALLDIRKMHLEEGTRLAISVGEWDGVNYTHPATITGQECSHSGIPTVTPLSSSDLTNVFFGGPTRTPDFVFTLAPTFTPPPTSTPAPTFTPNPLETALPISPTWTIAAFYISPTPYKSG